MAFKSSSENLLMVSHGIGGNKGLLPSKPLYKPFFIAVKNWFSVQLPIPVASGVKLLANDVPHGPIADVCPIENNTYDFIVSESYGPNFSSAGWPENKRSVSNAMPLSVNFLGVWQSWHPTALTRYSPR